MSYKQHHIVEKLFDCGDDNFIRVTTHTDGEGLELRVVAVDVSSGLFFKEELFRRSLLLGHRNDVNNGIEYIRLTDKGSELDGGDFVRVHPELNTLC